MDEQNTHVVVALLFEVFGCPFLPTTCLVVQLYVCSPVWKERVQLFSCTGKVSGRLLIFIYWIVVLMMYVCMLPDATHRRTTLGYPAQY